MSKSKGCPFKTYNYNRSVNYKPFNPESIGTTVSCYTLARFLDEIGNNSLNSKIRGHITKYFTHLRNLYKGIDCVDTRHHVGMMLLREVKHFEADLECPQHIANVIKNVKYCFIRDLFINEVPLNYSLPMSRNDSSTVSVDDIDDYYCPTAEFDFDER